MLQRLQRLFNGQRKAEPIHNTAAPLTYDRLAELAYKKITGGLTDTEAVELNSIINSSPDKKKFYEELVDPDAMAEQIVLMSQFDTEAGWERVKQRYGLVPSRTKKWWMKKRQEKPSKDFLKSINSGDIVIRADYTGTSKLIVRRVFGNLIEATPLKPETALQDIMLTFGLFRNDDNPYCSYYSITTGGVVEPRLGLDGHKPRPEHTYHYMWGELTAKA